MFDFLFRRGNASNRWSRPPGLELTVELSPPAINGTPLGSHVEDFSFLGRSSLGGPGWLEFGDLGVALDLEDDGTCSGFQVVFEDPDGRFQAFSGRLAVGRATVRPADLVDELGAPYWDDRDEDESVVYYEFSDYEIQLERTLEGENQRIIVTNQPAMADADHRRRCNVDKPWPPS
ncbi:hypothetical protein [Alienimonas chondri]|uniref:Uncharacterized protein n=1 Tax=Alienimonas chondri TaxID=2681879 RepID=A0ABX1VHC0_9PLAN|nr:hypothetical protein [Alienimonas chondri]NNJ27523.1 hypothetical protein [Alienimonas chondri]